VNFEDSNVHFIGAFGLGFAGGFGLGVGMGSGLVGIPGGMLSAVTAALAGVLGAMYYFNTDCGPAGSWLARLTVALDLLLMNLGIEAVLVPTILNYLQFVAVFAAEFFVGAVMGFVAGYITGAAAGAVVGGVAAFGSRRGWW
jgi:hypothetical protein